MTYVKSYVPPTHSITLFTFDKLHANLCKIMTLVVSTRKKGIELQEIEAATKI